MEIVERKESLIVRCPGYSLHWQAARAMYVSLRTAGFQQPLLIPSACEPPNGHDYEVKLSGRPRVSQKSSSEVRLEWTGQSSTWWRKDYVFLCREDVLEYFYVLHGDEQLDTLYFFEAAPSASLRKAWAMQSRAGTSGYRRRTIRLASPARFDAVFNPEPNGDDQQVVSAAQHAKISVNNDPAYCGQNWFFTPGILCFAFGKTPNRRWIGAGLVVNRGSYNFSDFEYRGGKSFRLCLRYYGYTKVRRRFESPHLLFTFGRTGEEAVGRYVEWLAKNGYVELQSRRQPTWWRGPIVCGWGEQCYQSDFFNLKGPKDRPEEKSGPMYANQANYEQFVRILQRQRLPYRLLIIDDKWQSERGLPAPDRGKWPDLRGFIDRMHRNGKRVVLWWGLFTGEGVLPEMCIVREGKKLSEDPTHPEFQRKLKRAIRFMLSSSRGSLNADGFKIDFTANIPSGYGCRMYGSIWGIELLKCYLDLIYSTAKRVKNDALIIAHAANPYFAPVIDMLRLNDICNARRTIVAKMLFRARMATLANPYWLIDMDNWPCPSLKAWREYMRVQPRHGVPSLYYITHIDTTGQPIPDAAWKELRKLWNQYLNTARK
jgi:hypothetical protein